MTVIGVCVGVVVFLVLRRYFMATPRKRVVVDKVVIGREGPLDTEGIPTEIMVFGQQYKRVGEGRE